MLSPQNTLAISGLIVGVLAILASTGPMPDDEIHGTIRRHGGVCLRLERWDLFGWSVVGQTRTVEDVQSGAWHSPVDSPPCSQVPEQEYLVRLPFDAPFDTYRICGLADDRGCIEFRRIPLQSRLAP